MLAKSVVRSLGPAVGAFLQLPGGWFRNNAGWIRGDEQTLVVDTCATEARTRQLLAMARARSVQNATPGPAAPRPAAPNSGTPISAVLTHAHGDHCNGAGLISREGGSVLASATAAPHVEAGPQTFPSAFRCNTWGELPAPAITGTVTEPRRIDLGRVEAEVLPVPTTAHTDGDLVVWCPREGILFTGDLLFSGVTPLGLHGSVLGWLDALDWLERFDAARIVPGHGPIATDHRPITALRDYLRWLLESTRGSREPDFAALQAQARKRWPHWLDAERHAANLRVAHAENRGTSPAPEELFDALLRSAGGPITLDL